MAWLVYSVTCVPHYTEYAVYVLECAAFYMECAACYAECPAYYMECAAYYTERAADAHTPTRWCHMQSSDEGSTNSD